MDITLSQKDADFILSYLRADLQKLNDNCDVVHGNLNKINEIRKQDKELESSMFATILVKRLNEQADEFDSLYKKKTDILVKYIMALKIWNMNSRITFFPTFDIAKAYPPGSDIPDILIADECDDPVKLIEQNDYLANHYPNWKVNKLFITATPTTNIDKKMLYETFGKDRVKIYRWGLHCGPRIPRKLLKEMKRGVTNA